MRVAPSPPRVPDHVNYRTKTLRALTAPVYPHSFLPVRPGQTDNVMMWEDNYIVCAEDRRNPHSRWYNLPYDILVFVLAPYLCYQSQAGLYNGTFRSDNGHVGTIYPRQHDCLLLGDMLPATRVIVPCKAQLHFAYLPIPDVSIPQLAYQLGDEIPYRPDSSPWQLNVGPVGDVTTVTTPPTLYRVLTHTVNGHSGLFTCRGELVMRLPPRLPCSSASVVTTRTDKWYIGSYVNDKLGLAAVGSAGLDSVAKLPKTIVLADLDRSDSEPWAGGTLRLQSYSTNGDCLTEMTVHLPTNEPRLVGYSYRHRCSILLVKYSTQAALVWLSDHGRLMEEMFIPWSNSAEICHVAVCDEAGYGMVAYITRDSNCTYIPNYSRLHFCDLHGSNRRTEWNNVGSVAHLGFTTTGQLYLISGSNQSYAYNYWL